MKKETREERTARQTTEYYARMRTRREREQQQQARQKQADERTATRAAERTRWRAYDEEVRTLTELQPLHQLPGIGLRGAGGYVLDHIYSVRAAYLAGWPAERAANIENLQLLPMLLNLRKGTACWSDLDSRRLPMAA